MPKFKIYVTEPDAINLTIVAQVMADTPHVIVEGNTEFTRGNYADCNAVLIRSATHITSSIKEKMPHLTHVARVGTGLDNVDLAFCERAGIAVYNAPGANAGAVAEYALTVIMMALRKLHTLTPSDVEMWNRFKFSGYSITSQTVGIVGFGHIGKLLYGKLYALGCRDFIVYDPFVKEVPADTRLATLDELLAGSGIISLHLPLLPQTTHIINAVNLQAVKDGAIIVNAARGGIVDEAAVLECVQTKGLTYIADTVEGEPHVNPALLGQPGVFITPHIASLTDEAEAAMVRIVVQNLLSGTVAAKMPA